jgi:uncharacterized phage protein (TIGR01671 family)
MQDRFKFRFWNGRGIIYDDLPHLELYNCEDYIWMQCTGLKDKNGKLIYQGDILGDIYEGLYIHYCEHCHQFQLYSQGYGCMACNGDIHWIEVVEDNKKLEVIGNIYENPELLEVE